MRAMPAAIVFLALVSSVATAQDEARLQRVLEEGEKLRANELLMLENRLKLATKGRNGKLVREIRKDLIAKKKEARPLPWIDLTQGSIGVMFEPVMRVEKVRGDEVIAVFSLLDQAKIEVDERQVSWKVPNGYVEKFVLIKQVHPDEINSNSTRINVGKRPFVVSGTTTYTDANGKAHEAVILEPFDVSLLENVAAR